MKRTIDTNNLRTSLAALPENLNLQLIGTLDYGHGVRYPGIAELDFDKDALEFVTWNTLLLTGCVLHDFLEGTIKLSATQKMDVVDHLDDTTVLVRLRVAESPGRQFIQRGQLASITHSQEGNPPPYGKQWYTSGTPDRWTKICDVMAELARRYTYLNNQFRIYYVATMAPTIQLLAYVDKKRRKPQEFTMDMSPPVEPVRPRDEDKS